MADKQQGAPKVSAVIITYNEERLIENTLSCLGWCDEIIIVDSGSTDNTVPICRRYGCTVYTRTFDGFGEQKKYGVAQARHDWILCLDADEVMTDALVAEVQAELGRPQIAYAGFTFPRELVFVNRVFHYGKEANDHTLRLFNRQQGNWDGAVVHERLCLDGPVKPLSRKLLHYSYHSYRQYMDKINLYSTFGAQKLYERKKTKPKWIVVLALPFNFLKFYFVDRNFLNGFPGFAWSVLSCISHLLKYLKLYELQEAHRSVHKMP